MLQILLKFNENVLKVVQSDRAEITVGRNRKNDIQIDNLAVSNFHAKIKRSGGKYSIEDLNSTNGTFINEKKINTSDLRDGDIASIGKHSLTFMLEGGTSTGEENSDLDMDQTMMLDTEKQRGLVGKKPSSPGAPARLEVQAGEASQDEYQLTERLIEIGKGDSCQVRLSGMFAPKNLAYITRDPNGYTLIPGDNAGKLRLNGDSLDKGVALQNNDMIEAGKLKLRFLLS